MMIGDEFTPTLTLGTQTLTIRQKAGTQATGTYTASDGSITLMGAI